MSADMIFLVLWLASCGSIVGIVVAAMNYDRIAVLLLRAVNAPVYENARRVAGAIYQRPEEWTVTHAGHALAHMKVGEVYYGDRVSILHIDNPAFGTWQPNAIERRIISDAVRWHHRGLVHKALS
jgi:hypothetical protein